jgi:hypothetical protein
MLRPYVLLMATKPSLSRDEILKAEYDYIANTVFQANEDRSRATSFYLLTFSSFIAAILSYQFDKSLNGNWVDWGFFALFIVLAFMGLLTVLQLARLRLAWYDSVQALNQIKDYYIEHNDGLEKAFSWRGVTAKKFKWKSVSFMLVVQVSILGGAALGAAIFFLVRAVSGNVLFLPPIAGGIAFLLWQLDLYRNNLK